MKDLYKIHFKKREDLRKWLEKNHGNSPGIWMIFYKKHTKEENITYDESVEEALCFGWIDSIIKRLDENKYVRKFTPRTNTENWSDANKRRVLKMVKNGKMTEAGLKKISIYKKTGKVDWEGHKTEGKRRKDEFDIPEFITSEFAKNEPALKNFYNLAPGYKKHYIFWITNAKREETLRKRLDESVRLLKQNKKLGLK